MIIIKSSGGSGSGSGSAGTLKSDIVPVEGDAQQDVVFASAFSADTYTLQITIYDGDGIRQGFTLDAHDVNGFTITPSGTGTLHWIAHLP